MPHTCTYAYIGDEGGEHYCMCGKLLPITEWADYVQMRDAFNMARQNDSCCQTDEDMAGWEDFYNKFPAAKEREVFELLVTKTIIKCCGSDTASRDFNKEHVATCSCNCHY